VADIADFYPRIYTHRLKAALEAATGSSHKDTIRVLEKLLTQFSGGPSYGIPVGPAASRPLAEAALIDVDSALKARGVDFVRFVDDFVIFGKTYESVEASLHFLGERLFLNHGLTLQTAKTDVFPAKEFRKKFLSSEFPEKEATKRRLVEIMMGDEYEERSYDELDEEEKSEVDAINLTEMLEEALAPGQAVDYHALALKEHFASAPPLLKTAILIGTKSLGDDERRYWLNSLKLTDPLERVVAFGHL
jgi:hypothetical protein